MKAYARGVSDVVFTLNGRTVRVANPEPQKTLLEFVREQGLTGAKEGCAEGECGACAVALVENEGRDGVNQGSVYRVVNSCLMFLPMADGREVYTVESLVLDGALSEAQSALASHGGSQCGYCTPGFSVSLFAEHHRPDRHGPCDIMALSGNLCRCTGYRPIRDAAQSLGAAPDSVFSRRLREATAPLRPYRTPGFSRPRSVEECVETLKSVPSAKIIAGGTDVAVESNLRGSRWSELISVEAIDELRQFTTAGDRIRIGAALPLTEIGRLWVDAPDELRTWLGFFASPLIRNRATLGGNLATASPIGDGAPLLLAMDASLQIAGVSGRRNVPLAEFFTGYRKTRLGAAEIIVSIEIPLPLPASLRFYKIAKRRLDDISTVAMAIGMDFDSRSRVSRARFALGGVAATPIRVTEAETAVMNAPWNETAVAGVQEVFGRTLKPLTDHRGSKEYRLEVSKSLVEKYFWEQRP